MSVVARGSCQVMSCWRLAADGQEFCSEHGWQETSNGNAHVEDRVLLDRMDAGEPVAAPVDREEDALEDASSNGRRPRGELQRLVLAALADGHTSPAAIGRAVGIPGQQASTAITKVVRKGLAGKAGYGVFVITDAGREALATGHGLDVARDRNVSVIAASGPPVAEKSPRPEGAEPEPEIEPEVEPEVEEDDPATIIATANAEILQILDLLDVIDAGSALVVNGTTDAAALPLIRRLLRDELRHYPVEDIGDAVLARIDARVFVDSLEHETTT